MHFANWRRNRKFICCLLYKYVNGVRSIDGGGGGTIGYNNVQAAVRAMETRTRGHTINMHRYAFHLSVCQTGILCSSWEPTPAVDRELKGDVGGSGGEGEKENRGNIHTTSCCERNAKLLTLWCLLLFHSS